MTHAEARELAAAYAIGALDAGEVPAFEAHLSGCGLCKAEVNSFEETAALLANGVRSHEPVAGLRARIIALAGVARPISSAGSGARVRGRTHFAWYAAAAALLLTFASLAAWRRERARSAALGGELATATKALAERDSVLQAFMGPEVHVVSLTQSDAKPSARVYWNHTRNVFIVTAFNVPPAPAGKTYQLWALRNGQVPLSMGTFTTDAAGHATAVLAVAPAITGGGHIDNCGLTLEPVGGSLQPTETPRLLGAWRHVD